MPARLLKSLSASKNVTPSRSEEHTSELQSQSNLVCRLLLEKKKKQYIKEKMQKELETTLSKGRKRKCFPPYCDVLRRQKHGREQGLPFITVRAETVPFPAPV